MNIVFERDSCLGVETSVEMTRTNASVVYLCPMQLSFPKLTFVCANVL